MGKDGNEAVVQYYMSSPDGRPDRGGESNFVIVAKDYDEEKSAEVGRLFAACGVCIQHGDTFYYSALSNLGGVWLQMYYTTIFVASSIA
jgi:hypothetical protein